MNHAPTPEFDVQLLDLHLGHLSETEQAALQARLLSEPRLAEQHSALTAVFDALQRSAEVPMPRDLVARTTTRVRQAGPVPRIVRPADALTAAVERRSERVIRLGNLRDIVAVAAMIVLAVGVGVPTMLHMRDRAQRVGCSYNLAQLGIGMQQYASSFGSSLPFAGWSGRASWKPTDEPGAVNVPNRRHVYTLLVQAYVTEPQRFVCPSQPHMPMSLEEVRRSNDFLEARNVSYAYQNMAGVRPSANDDPRLPIMADENPLFADGVPLFDARRFTGRDAATQNSRAHRSAGQNILTLRGEVIWSRTPFAGLHGDNIWTLENVQVYTGHEGPQRADDAHLLK
ncbi:MAG: DUF1559 domain-containing protein [Phycisphaerales bacterium]|nr:DUF1559 domain-containing protein [Phycisphaerales bacterium]